MPPRIPFASASPGVYKALSGLETYLRTCGLEPGLLHLVKLRVSQLNGCAYCLDMHSKDALAGGDSVQRLIGLDAWREAPYYTDRERAALAWAEAVTNLHPEAVSDAVFDDVRPYFTDKELADLTLAIAAINSWNRFRIAFRVPAGSYPPAAHRATVPA